MPIDFTGYMYAHTMIKSHINYSIFSKKFQESNFKNFNINKKQNNIDCHLNRSVLAPRAGLDTRRQLSPKHSRTPALPFAVLLVFSELTFPVSATGSGQARSS